MSKIYVNADYADKEPGVIDGDKVYGSNAFGSLLEAVDAQTADTSEIVIESDISEALSGKTVSGKITADKAVTVADSANSNYVNLNKTEIGKNVTVDAKYFYLYGENTIDGTVKSSSTFYSSGKLILTGNATVYTTMSRNYGAAEDGIYIVGTAAANEGKNAAAQYTSINSLCHYSGTFSVKDTAAEFGFILLNGSNDGDIQAKLVLDNASVKTIGGPNTQPGQVLMNDDAAIIATNDSVLDFRGPKNFGYLKMEANNSISLTDSALLLGKEGQGTNNLNGKITLVNSELSSLGTLNNGGTITIDGTSTITAAKINNTGTITIDLKGYTGDTVKVIDLTQDGQLTGVTVKNAGNNYYLTYGDDGDVTVNKSPEFIYVSSDYNSSTEGWGVTKFSSWDGAYAFSSVYAKKATMVFEKTTTISGNCFPKQADYIAAIVVKDGAAVGNANSKWDAVFAMTIEGGGILQSARPASASIGNTHVKNKWIIGEADSEKRAEIRFINGKSGIAYQTMSISLLAHINRSIVANNALIEVGDMGLLANASFTDTILTIDGILAIKGTALYKTTMTDTTVTIKGHNLMNENTYYSTVGTIFGNLTLDNTSITVDDGADDTAAEKVWLGYTGNVAQTLTLTNGSSITIEKDAEVAVANKVSVTDSSITAGTVDASVTKAGNSSFYFNQLEKGKVYYAVLYDAEGNELETIVRTSTSGSTFYPKFSVQPAGDYKAVCYKDEAKTEIHQEKKYTFTAIGTVDLVNSDFNVDTLKLAGNNFNMDIDSTVAFKTISGGTITVSNADEYTNGNYNLFDYTGEGSMTEADYKAILGNVWNDNYKVLWNDLYLSNQATDTIYVNAEWAAAENGDTVGDGYLYGYNAVSSFTDVADMINLDGSDTVIKIEGNFNVDKTMDFTYNTGNITFTADEAVTVSQTAELDFGFVLANDITVTVDENVTFNIYSNASGWYMYYGPSLELYGTITGGGNWGCTYLFDGTHTVYESGEISTGRVQLGYTDITVKGTVDTNYLLAEASVFTAQGATITAGVIHDSNNGGMRWGAAEFNFTDASVVNAGNIYLKYADSVMNINNSTLNVSGAFENAGIVNITDTAFTDVITNNGTVELNGNVTLDADTISGTAAVDSDKDAVLSVTDFVYDAEGANLLINANVGIEQIVSVNGCEVNTVVGSYYYVENGTVYHLGVSGEQIIVAQIDGAITIETEAVQKDGEYSFVFTVASDGIGTDDEVVYTLTVNGKNYAVTDNTVTWTAADFAGSLPASFDYIITATDHFGRTGIYNGTFTDIKDYDNPYAENIKFADGKLSFAVADNSGLFSSVTVNGAEAEIVDGICSVDAVAGETYTIVVTDKAGLTAEYSYKVAEPVKPADNGSSVIASGTDIVTESITSEGNVNIGSNSNVVTEEITVAPGENNNVVLNNNVELTVTGSVDVSANLFVSSTSKVNINNFNGTDEGDDIYIGKDSVANFAAVDMKDGYDTAYIAGGVEFTADSVSNLDSLNIAAEGKVVVKNAWDVAGTDDAVIKVGSYASFEAGSITGDSVNLTLNRNANAVIGDANINKLTVQAGAMLKVGKVTATAEDNVFSMAGSTAVINGIDFGAGNDTLTLSSGANLILTGAIDGLERISANRSATIFVADTAAKDALAQISGYKESIVDIVDYQSGIIAGDNFIIGGGNADLFVLSGEETLTIDGVASENISYFSLADKTWLTATDNFSFNAADVSLVKVESALDYKATLA